MAPGRAVLVMLVLSTLWACGAVPEPGQRSGGQWVWGTAGRARAEPPALSRRRRDDGGQQPNATSTRHPALAVPTTAEPLDETDSSQPDLLSSAPAPSTQPILHRALAVPTTADPLDETDSPEPDLLSSAPAPSTQPILHRALAVPTTTDPLDETESSKPDLLLNSSPPTEPGTEVAPQKSITTTPSRLASPSKEKPTADGMASGSATPPALDHTATGYKKVEKAPTATARPAPWDARPGGTAVPMPWDPSGVMGKCMLAMLLLALVAATFMVCTGVLGALLWRRARTAQRRLSHTEMICISSLLPDGEVAANGPRPVPVRRQKVLLDGCSEAEGDNLTLSSFLPEHS